MAQATTQKSDIPQRSDIEEKYKWDLTDIYKSDAQWEEDFKKAQEIIDRAEKYKDRLTDSPDTLFECLEDRSKLSMICKDLYQYAKLNQDLDNRVSKYQAMTDRAAMLSSKADAAYSFVEPELNSVDDSRLKELADGFPKKDIYDFYFENLIRARKHIRSQEVEELLAQSHDIARSPDAAFTMLDDADIKYPRIKDEKGNEIQLTKQRFAKILMQSPSQQVRGDANEAFHKVYKDHVNTLNALLAGEVRGNIFYARARKHESALHSALFPFNIPTEVYHSLLDTTEANLEGLNKWMELRRKILGLEKIYPYDIYCQLFPEQSYDVEYNDAIKEVLTAVEPLGKKYGEVMKRAFDNRWVDVYETEGKASGAFNWGNFGAHPFILMNYNDTVDNMFTLAHEMGHAMHSYLSSQKQPFPKAQYSIFVAEVASTLNEGLLLNHLLKSADDDKKKLYLLNRHIDNTMGTFFHQVLYARFELTIHEMVERGEALSPDKLNEMWHELTQKFYGPSMTMDDFTKYKWSRIPHFYMTFYVYQYATSYAASQAILDKFLAGEEGIIEKYLELISSGGNDYPINQLKKCGVDMTTSAPIEATIKLFGKQVDEVARLTGNE